MASSTWLSCGARVEGRALARQWYGHLAGVLPLWIRLSAPFALGGAWLSRTFLPLLVAPLAAALYTAAYVGVRRIPGFRIPLGRLRAFDTALLAGAAVVAAGALQAAGAPAAGVWCAGMGLGSLAWCLNWLHEGLPVSLDPSGRDAGTELPPTPAFIPPATGPVSAGYRSYDRSHTGVDLAVPVGTAVRAPAAGRVIHAGPLGQWGYAVLLDHGNGWSTLVAHLDRTAVRRRDQVAAGDLIAWSGTSGISTGPHLHLELRYRGRPVDPAPLL